MTRCMLHEKELPKELWAEAANTAVFLLNRLPTRVLHKKTPFEGLDLNGNKYYITFIDDYTIFC